MASTIQVRVDNDLKSKSDKLFHDLGTDTTTAIRIFLTQAVEKGECRDADVVIDDMRKKYDL